MNHVSPDMGSLLQSYEDAEHLRRGLVARIDHARQNEVRSRLPTHSLRLRRRSREELEENPTSSPPPA